MKITYVLYSHINKAIKIGYATNLANRISTIQISTPEELSLLFAFQGGKEVETELNKLHKDWFIIFHGFTATKELTSVLIELNKKS